jgi:hypothetical protein
MKVTVLKASKDFAQKISADLLEMKMSSGKPMFKRFETETGFKIVGRTKNSDGAIVEKTVFEYINYPAPKFIYDDRLINL